MYIIKLFLFIAVTFSAINVKFTSANSAESAKLIPVDLNQFAQSFLTFCVNMAQIFNETYINVNTDLNQFKGMNGIEPILALPSLMSQFITPYAICKEQVDIQIAEFQSILSSSKPSGVNVFFTQNQLNTFYAALSMLSYYDVAAVNSLVDQIDSSTSMIFDPSFHYNSDTLQMSYAVAVNFTNSLSNFLAGNNGLVQAFAKILNLNEDTISAQQNNVNSHFFIESLFNYFSGIMQAYTSISNEIECLIKSFYSQHQIVSGMYSAPISTVVNSVNEHSQDIANIFEQLSNILMSFEMNIINPKYSQ